MTGKADFTDEEWSRLKRSPFVAGMAISLSDPGGPIELAKETAATLKTVTNVVHERRYVKDETRARVKAAIAELGYTPSLVGRQLRVLKQGLNAVVIVTKRS